MNLSAKPMLIDRPETNYVFVEKIGPFQQTAAAAWKELGQFMTKIQEHNSIVGRMSLVDVEKKIYRACMATSSLAQKIPETVQHETMKAGKYHQFTLKGSYSELPTAWGKVLEMVAEQKLKVRADFCIENYVTAYGTTPENEAITEILIPAF